MNDTELIKSLEKLKESIDKFNSFWRTFLLGIVRGVGAVIGATLLAGLVLSWLSITFSTVSEVPVIGDFFSSLNEAIEESPSGPAQ